MEKKQERLTDEKLLELLKDDSMVSALANPCYVHDRYGQFAFLRTVTYPIEYIVSEEQVAKAKAVHAQRKKTILGNIVPGMLVFGAMGGNFQTETPDQVGNWRIRSNFTADDGKRYMIEFSAAVRGTGFYVTGAIDYEAEKEYDRQEQEVAEWNRSHLSANEHKPWPPQTCYNPFNVRDNLVDKDFTFTNILEFVNTRFGCSYSSCSLIRHIVGYEQFTCEPIKHQSMSL